MGKPAKIALITLLLILVFLGGFPDIPLVHTWLGVLDMTLYSRLVALAGLTIACFVAWGYKKKIEATQKYRRAQTVLSEAEKIAQRKKDALTGLEEKLKIDYAGREKRFQEEMEELKIEYNKRILALKEQNVQLKDAAAKLMGALKRKGA